jgi:hypothetical protein
MRTKEHRSNAQTSSGERAGGSANGGTTRVTRTLASLGLWRCWYRITARDPSPLLMTLQYGGDTKLGVALRLIVSTQGAPMPLRQKDRRRR